MSVERTARAAAAAALLFVAALQVHRIDDSDTWWHLASGRLIAAERSVPHGDPFSYTAAGAPWINRQWLFDLAAYAAWRAGGSSALILGTGALFLAGFGCLYALVRRRLPPWGAAMLVFLAAEAGVERLTVRPEAVTFAFLGAYLLILDRAALGPAVAAGLVLLQIVWANSHALSVLGVAVLAAELGSAAAALWLPLPAGWRTTSRRDRQEVVWLGVAAGCAVAAEAATPFGMAGALLPIRLLGVLRGAEVTSAPVIEHRAPTLAELSPPAALGLVALLGLAIVAAVISFRRWRLSHVLLALAFTPLALLARRNVALLGPGLLPLIADGLGPVAAAAEGRLARRPLGAAALGAGLVAVFAIAACGVVTGGYYDAARLTRTFGLGESAVLFPGGALDFLDAHAPGARLFNDDLLGGYVLWRSYPRRRVFIDGRLQMYPAEVYREYQRTLDDPRTFSAVAARHGVTAAMLYHPAPGRLELAAAVARLPGWRIAYLDAGCVVLVADGSSGLPVAGIDHPVVGARTGGVARSLEGVLDRLRPPVEEAVAHYQRGRAVLYLLHGDGVAPARADFQTALRLWPGFEDARAGLRVTDAQRAPPAAR